MEQESFVLPESSNKHLKIASYIAGTVVSIAGLFFIYEIIANSGWTIEANWNIFKSPIGNICIFIGLFCAIIFWGKMGHWTRTPVEAYKNEWGNTIKVRENYDLIEQLLWKFFFPILGHFIIEPIIYGAIIYYPLMCVVAVVGSLLPYIISLMVLAICGMFFIYHSFAKFKGALITLITFAVLLTVGFGYGAYYIMEESGNNLVIELPREKSSSSTSASENGFDESEFENSDGNDEEVIDESEFE